MTQFLFSSELKKITKAVMAACGTELSKKVVRLIEEEDWDSIASMRCSPRDYESAESYRFDAIAVNFLRKLEALPVAVDREAKAVANFYDCERQCYQTNLRLRDIRLHGADIRLTELIREMRKIVATILGRAPGFVQGRFGPGSTFSDKGSLTTVGDKMTSSPTLYSDSYPWLFQWSSTSWCRAVLARGVKPEFVRGNRFATAPKDAENFRGIGIESSISGFYQLGLGRHIRRRLKLFGIDLESGQDIHRQVACEGSIKGHVATLDLKNASDNISIEFVKALVPREWFELLSSLRAPRTLIKGQWVHLEKFSSMGNGFTFELETLLFAVVSLVASGKTLSSLGNEVFAYGDDLIVPTENALDVIAALSFFGLTINKEKSFWTGSFRESCGGDYFNGEDVRPHFLKELPCEPQDYIKLANGINRLRYQNSSVCPDDDRFRIPWFYTLDCLPTNIRRCRGPVALGDVVIHDAVERWDTLWRDGIRYLRSYQPVSYTKIGWQHFWPDVQLACALAGHGDGVEGLTPRDAVTGHGIRLVAYS